MSYNRVLSFAVLLTGMFGIVLLIPNAFYWTEYGKMGGLLVIGFAATLFIFVSGILFERSSWLMSKTNSREIL